MIRTSATPSPRATLGRRTTAVDAVAEDYLATFAALDPCAATEMGITGHDDDITDYSPDGVAARAEAARSALRELDGVTPEDDVDVVTLAAMRERLGVQIELHDAGLDVGELNVIASPLQTMRDVFDLMATDTDDDWALISLRLSRVPDRVAGYADGVAGGRGRRATRPPSGRSPVAIEQAGQIQQLFVDMVADAAPDNETLHAELQERASAAADAYSRLAAVLRDEIGPHARGEDAFGRDAYRLLSRAVPRRHAWISTKPIDWGLQPAGKPLSPNRKSIAQRLYPGASVAEALRRLERGTPLRRARHRRAAGLDAGPVRSGDGGARRHAFRDRRAAAPPGMPDSADANRRHLLHRPVGGPDPAGPDVVVGSARRRHLPHLAGDHNRLSRGRPRTPPADRPCGDPGRSTQPVAPAGLLGVGSRRGLGALRRAADGRPRLARRRRQPDGNAGRPTLPGCQGGDRHRRALRADRPRRRRLGCREGVGVPVHPLRAGRGDAALRTGPLPGLARPSAVVCDRPTDLAAAARRDAGPVACR